MDGISYQGKAESLSESDFFELSGLPRNFRNVTVTFRFTDGKQQEISVPYGATLYSALLPEIPAAAYTTAQWVGAVDPDEKIYFDTVYTAVHTDGATVLESNATGRNRLPVFLAQGHFSLYAALTAEPLNDEGALSAWNITIPDSPTAVTIRYQLPDGCDPEKILLQQSSGANWADTEFTVDGTYLVFTVQEDTTSLRILPAPQNNTQLYLLGAGALALIGLIVLIALLCKKRKKAK